MNVGIDARMYGPSVGGGGLGRYVEQLVNELAEVDRENAYLLFLKRKNLDAAPTSANMEKRLADIPWYTLREQLAMPRLIDGAELDLAHFPHWNVPLALKTPFVLTIHDLILLEEPRSAKVTTRHPLLFGAKYLAFRRVLKSALGRARQVIAVSEYTKHSVLKHFPDLPEEKISVIHEGVTNLPSSPAPPPSPASLPAPYFLYVGNAYPHKNLEALLHAFSFFHRLRPDVHLVFAGRRDVFYDRLAKELDEIGVNPDNVHFRMNPSDEELAGLYARASLFLVPSRIEGFGLPALEAMQQGIPVAAARSGSLPEVLGEAALYFSPTDIEQMVSVMERALADEALRESLVAAGTEQTKKYSWRAMAEKTVRVYERALS